MKNILRVPIHNIPLKEVFQIKRVLHTNPITYSLIDLSGEPIQGSFYNEELVRVKKPTVFEIEEVIKTRKEGKKTMYLVKYRHYPESMNEWLEGSVYKKQLKAQKSK